LYSEESKCTRCKTGYAIGLESNCSTCDEGYIYTSLDPLVCEIEIQHCISYISTECLACESGYVLLSECVPEIPFCLEYDKFICISCQDGYEIDEENKCSNIIVLETVYDDLDLSSSDGEENITQAQIDRGRKVDSSNSVASYTASASTSISSLISMDPNTLILFMNTIQLISCIQYLNIPLPFEIKKQQSSTNKFIRKTNILTYMRIEDKDLKNYIGSSLDDEYSFTASAIYTMLVLFIVISQNVIIYLFCRYGKGKVKEKATKILKYFKYTIYIQIYITTYLNIIDTSISKLTNVIYN
jgi:hypothetical protein